MDFFEFNKIAGAVLATALAVMALSIIAGIIYAPVGTEQPGYVIALAEPSGGEEAAAAGGEAAAAGGEEAAAGGGQTSPIAALLRTADAAAGEKSAKKCAACHTFDKGGKAKVGPNLYGVVGEKAAHVEGFKYSAALLAKRDEGLAWTFENLDHFLSGPKAWLPGTAMTLVLKKEDERANVIAFLRTLSDNPVPLPQDTAATTQDAPMAEPPATEPASPVEPAPQHSTEMPAPAPAEPAQ